MKIAKFFTQEIEEGLTLCEMVLIGAVVIGGIGAVIVLGLGL